MDIAVLGIDLSKNSCSVVGLDGSGKVVLRRLCNVKPSWSWPQSSHRASLQWRPAAAPIILDGLSQLKDTQFGLMSPEYVRPYVKAQKNNDRDAEAIAEAATRPALRYA